MALDRDYAFTVGSDKASFQGQSLPYLMGFANYFTGITIIYSTFLHLFFIFAYFFSHVIFHLVIFSHPRTDVTGIDFFPVCRAFIRYLWAALFLFPGRNCLDIDILLSWHIKVLHILLKHLKEIQRQRDVSCTVHCRTGRKNSSLDLFSDNKKTNAGSMNDWLGADFSGFWPLIINLSWCYDVSEMQSHANH